MIKHVLQTVAALLKKANLEGNIADDVPIEVRYFSHLPTRIFHIYDITTHYYDVYNNMIARFQVIGDVLRIRQILTNLIRYCYIAHSLKGCSFIHLSKISMHYIYD